MAKLTLSQREYLLPMLRSIESNILSLQHRIQTRDVSDWHHSEFSIVASTATQLAGDAQWITTALEVIRDIEAYGLEEK